MQKPAYTSQAQLEQGIEKTNNSKKWNAGLANRYQYASQDIVSNCLKSLQAILCNTMWQQQLSFQLLLVWGTGFDEPSVKGSTTPTGTGLCRVHTHHLKKRKRKEKFTLFSDHNGSLLRRQPGALAMWTGDSRLWTQHRGKIADSAWEEDWVAAKALGHQSTHQSLPSHMPRTHCIG